MHTCLSSYFSQKVALLLFGFTRPGKPGAVESPGSHCNGKLELSSIDITRKSLIWLAGYGWQGWSF